MVNVITHWNTIYMERALQQLRSEGWTPTAADLARLSPLGTSHLNVLGRYTFELAEPLRRGEWRPLRRPISTP